MSGVKGRSGRRPREIENRKILRRLYPLAVTRICEILNNPDELSSVKLEAAKIVIYQVDGKPRFQVDHTVKALIGIASAQQLEEAIKLALQSEAKLIAEYSIKTLEEDNTMEEEEG